jgi:hypothetical protein
VGGVGSILEEDDAVPVRQNRFPAESDVPRYTLETIIVVLLLLWLLGAFIIPTAGSLIHLLLLVVLVVVVIRLLQGRRVL